MTSTSFNVGLNSETRNSSKVLKPPGGGSSDIFGAGDVAEPQRRTKTHHLSSSLSFGGEDTPTPARNRAGNDSFYNLFGTEPQFRPTSAIKDKLMGCVASDQLTTNEERVIKKSINFEDSQILENTVSDSNGTGDSRNEECETNGVAETNRTVSDECQEVSPVSTEVPSVNGTATTNSAASTPAPTPTAQAPVPAAARPRVPPGGFSSGLW